MKAGRLRALAVSTAQRSALMPELPTLIEAGVAGYEYNAWNGAFAPRGTPRAMIDRLFGAFHTALADADVRQQFGQQGLQPLASDSPAQFGAFLRADFERVARLVKIAGIKPE